MFRALRLTFPNQNKYFFCSAPFEPIVSTVQIIEKQPINHDSYIYKLKFIDKSFRLGIGQHFRIVETIKTYQCPQGEEVVRKYTPINSCDQIDVLDLLVKIYRPNSNISFPNGGKLTPYLQKLGVGDKMHIEGPLGKFGYEAGGKVFIDGKPKEYKRIFFMAGGSGITPCFQVIKQIVKMQDQNIQLILLFANKTEQDILLRSELQSFNPRAQIHYILDQAPQNWQGFKGYITEDILQQICPLNDSSTLYVHCGPFAMNSFVRQLFKRKYPQSKLFKF